MALSRLIRFMLLTSIMVSGSAMSVAWAQTQWGSERSQIDPCDDGPSQTNKIGVDKLSTAVNQSSNRPSYLIEPNGRIVLRNSCAAKFAKAFSVPSDRDIFFKFDAANFDQQRSIGTVCADQTAKSEVARSSPSGLDLGDFARLALYCDQDGSVSNYYKYLYFSPPGADNTLADLYVLKAVLESARGCGPTTTNAAKNIFLQCFNSKMANFSRQRLQALSGSGDRDKGNVGAVDISSAQPENKSGATNPNVGWLDTDSSGVSVSNSGLPASLPKPQENNGIGGILLGLNPLVFAVTFSLFVVVVCVGWMLFYPRQIGSSQSTAHYSDSMEAGAYYNEGEVPELMLPRTIVSTIDPPASRNKRIYSPQVETWRPTLEDPSSAQAAEIRDGVEAGEWSQVTRSLDAMARRIDEHGKYIARLEDKCSELSRRISDMSEEREAALANCASHELRDGASQSGLPAFVFSTSSSDKISGVWKAGRRFPHVHARLESALRSYELAVTDEKVSGVKLFELVNDVGCQLYDLLSHIELNENEKCDTALAWQDSLNEDGSGRFTVQVLWPNTPFDGNLMARKSRNDRSEWVSNVFSWVVKDRTGRVARRALVS